MLTKIAAGAAMPIALITVFWLVGVPAWAWALPVLVVLIEAAMIARAHYIDTHR